MITFSSYHSQLFSLFTLHLNIFLVFFYPSLYFPSSTDNVALNIDGVLYLRIIDPYRASYGVEDPEFAITQLAQTTMRSVCFPYHPPTY